MNFAIISDWSVRGVLQPFIPFFYLVPTLSRSAQEHLGNPEHVGKRTFSSDVLGFA